MDTVRKSIARIKHAKIIEDISTGKCKNLIEAARKYGYSDSYANSGSVTRTDTWKEMLEESMPDDLLLKYHKKGLTAKNVIYATRNGKIMDIKKVPDNSSRYKYLDLAYKAKQKYAEQHKVTHQFGDLADGELEARRTKLARRILEIGLGDRKKKRSKQG